MQVGTIFQTAALLGLPDFHQQANKSITLLGITQDIPNRVKTWVHRVEATSQWRRRWSTVSPSLLHKQHLSTMTILLFLRLSTVSILPRAADHEKKAALEGAWVRHTLFQGKQLPSEPFKELNYVLYFPISIKYSFFIFILCFFLLSYFLSFLSLYNSLGSIIATQGFKGNTGKLMWVIFYDFFQIFPIFKEGNHL